MAYPVMTAERFWAKVDKSGPIVREELGPCWLWPRISIQGYGKTTIKLKHWLAHRLAWVYTYGEIPDEICVCHTCDTRNCVRPSHLWLGTNQENTADKVAKGRQAHGLMIAANQTLNKLNLKSAEEIRQLRKDGWTTNRLAEKYGVCSSNISMVLRGETWNHNPCG